MDWPNSPWIKEQATRLTPFFDHDDDDDDEIMNEELRLDTH